MRNIFIGGGTASGKSTIIYLFDGHPEFLVNAIHFQIIEAFQNLINNYKKIKDRKIIVEKNFCFFLEYKRKNYYITEQDLENIFFDINVKKLEKYSNEKTYPNHTSALKKDFLKFNFDFQNFMKNLKNDLENNKDSALSFETFIEKFYYNFFSNWLDKKFILSNEKFSEKSIVSKLPTNISSIEFALNNIPNSKIIYVDRKSIGIMKSRVLNFMKIRNLDIRDFDRYFLIFSKGDFFKKINYQKKKIKLLKKRFPDKIFLTSLEALIDDKEKEMKKVSMFLNIKFEEILTKITYLSEKIKDNHLDQINDDRYQISEKSEFFFDIMDSNWNYSNKVNKLFYIKYFKEFLLSLYLRIKFLFIKI